MKKVVALILAVVNVLSCAVLCGCAPKLESIELNPGSLELVKLQSSQLEVALQPENAKPEAFTWKSSDPGIASVDENGNVTANAVGNAKITAESESGIKSYCLVTVTPLLPEDINLGSSSLEITKLGTSSLSASIIPDAADNKAVTWRSSDGSIATVDAKGNVSAIGIGDCIITAESSNGLTAECKITVLPLLPESISLNHESKELVAGTRLTLEATILPSETDDKTIKWSSSNPGVASVTSDGIVIANSWGTCTVTAATANGLTASCSISVRQPIEATSISFNTKSLELIDGSTAKLTVSFVPKNVDNKDLVWTSSDASIATVSQDGTVTGISKGTCVITAVASNGVKAECEVKVKESALSFLINYLDKNKDKNGDIYLEGKSGSSKSIFLGYVSEDSVNLYEYTITGYYLTGAVVFISSYDADGVATGSYHSVSLDCSLTYDYKISSFSEYSYNNLSLNSLAFQRGTDSTYKRMDFCEMAADALLKLESKLLIPNGYTLADLGYTTLAKG